MTEDSEWGSGVGLDGSGVDPAVVERIEALAPPPPLWLPDSEDAKRRWRFSSRLAAVLALRFAPDPGEAAAFATVTARALYESHQLV